ncbi:integrase, partial [Escherichia coli]|nr:integrase [Escherichia coli]
CALLVSGLWCGDAVEREMSHQGRIGVRAAFFLNAEHLDERRLMLLWWADFLHENIQKLIRPF